MEGILFPRGVVEGKESLDAYRARGGYQALEKALKQMSPRDVLQEIDASGLRGRGGAGFPTGKKWAFTADTPDRKSTRLNSSHERIPPIPPSPPKKPTPPRPPHPPPPPPTPHAAAPPAPPP